MIFEFFFPIFRPEKFDHFSQPKHGYENVDGNEADSPTSFDEIERPPLRYIDKYARAEIPGLSARFTVAVLTCLGFIIQFAMKTNLSSFKDSEVTVVFGFSLKKKYLFFFFWDKSWW